MSYWTKYKSEVSVKEHIGDLDAKLTFSPIELLVLSDLEGVFSKERYNNAKQNFCDHIYCTVDITNTPLSKRTGDEIKGYFARDRQKLFSLFVGKDSFPCILYQPETISDAEKLVRVNLVFPRPENQPCDMPLSEDLSIAFKTDEFNSDQTTRFYIKKEMINQLPKIKF